jgi:hypothetical protein
VCKRTAQLENIPARESGPSSDEIDLLAFFAGRCRLPPFSIWRVSPPVSKTNRPAIVIETKFSFALGRERFRSLLLQPPGWSQPIKNCISARLTATYKTSAACPFDGTDQEYHFGAEVGIDQA